MSSEYLLISRNAVRRSELSPHHTTLQKLKVGGPYWHSLQFQGQQVVFALLP